MEVDTNEVIRQANKSVSKKVGKWLIRETILSEEVGK